MNPAKPFLLLFLLGACGDDVVSPPAPARPHASVVVENVSVVMSGLRSPRGLAWGPEGALYVAEAGTSQQTGGCVAFMEGATLSSRCYSGTGAVSRLFKGEQTRVADGLPSTFIAATGFTSGPQAISLLGRGNALIASGWGGHPDLRGDLAPAGHGLGSLIQLQPSGGWRVVADISGFEAAHNPDGRGVDSNPFDVLAEPAGAYVIDAGGNTLLHVRANGEISVVSTFPTTAAPPPFLQADAVPTRVRRGPDGALYVSTLSGVPFLDGSAAIYRVMPGQAPQLYAGGFKAITDFAFAPDGGLYVVQFATGAVFFGGPGALINVAPDGTRTTITTALFHPTAVLVGADGSVYVANRGSGIGLGEVLRFTFSD
jgi:hypothetical protein